MSLCTIEPDGDIDDETKTVGKIKDNYVMLYKDELVLEFDFDNNYCITMRGIEHVGEHKMTTKSYERVRVFNEVK
jgi:hypothetical protein